MRTNPRVKMTGWKSLLISTLLCAGTAVSADNYDTWRNFKTIIIDTRNLAGSARVLTSQTNFPLLVRLKASNAAEIFDSSKVSGGGDIRFSSGATHLSYEKERWDAVNKLAEFWVSAPLVKGNDTTQIQIYWNKPGATDSSKSPGMPGVFATSNNFVSTWHLGDSTGNRANSVSGAPAAIPVNYTGTFKTGIIGGADSLRNQNTVVSSRDHLRFGSYPGYSDFTGGMTLSIWAYPTGAAHFFFLGTDTGAFTDCIQALKIPTGNNVQFKAYNSTSPSAVITGPTTTKGAAPNTWQHFVFTISGNTATIYKNGVLDTSGSINSLRNITRSTGYLGRAIVSSDSGYRGLLDETEISNVARSADWVKLSYQTQRSDSSYMTLGSTQSLFPLGPSGLSYSPNPATFSTNVGPVASTAFLPLGSDTITYSVLTGSLPPGLSLNGSTGNITGTPTTAGNFEAIIQASNTAGADTETVRFAVLQSPAGFTYAMNSPTYATGTAIVPDSATIASGVASRFKVTSGVLPSGLTMDTTTGVISGIPTVGGAFSPTITASNAGGGFTTTTIFITVIGVPTITSQPSSRTAQVGDTVKFGITAASLGPLSYRWVRNNTDTVASAFSDTLVLTNVQSAIDGNSYKCVVSNVAGVTASDPAFLNLKPRFTYTTPVNYVRNLTIASNTPVSTGGSATHYSVTPALPTGLRLDSITGIISGTPSVQSLPTIYTVTGTGPGGTATTTLIIGVFSIPTNLSYSDDAPTGVLGVASSANIPTVTGLITHYSIAPPLPPGLVLDSISGIISGIPTGNQSFAKIYAIAASNPVGSTSTILTITIVGAPSNLSYLDDAPTYARGVRITPPNTPTIQGIVTYYTVTPAFPPGIFLDGTTGYILGTPVSIVASSNYTVTGINPGGSTSTIIYLGVATPP